MLLSSDGSSCKLMKICTLTWGLLWPCRVSPRSLSPWLWSMLLVGAVPEATVCGQSSHVIVPAYERFRGERLDAVAAGRLLISELNCQACHGVLDGAALAPRTAPLLTDVHQRVSSEHLRQFIADPQRVKPGTAMPAVPALQQGAEAARRVEALTSFLTAGSTFRPAPVATAAVRRGESLFHTVGCAACHGDLRRPPEQRAAFAVPLGDLTAKYAVGGLAGFLLNPHAVRPSGRMPSLNLSPEEARDIASYLLRDVRVEPSLRFEYFEGTWERLPDFSQLSPAASGGATDFSVDVASRRDTFALRFTGFLQLPQQAEYQFWLSSDDGSRLIIDGQTVLDHDGVHPGHTKDGRVTLSAGPHALVLEYFELHGEETLSLEIAGGGLARQPAAGLVSPEREPRPVDAARPQIDQALVDEGRQLFADLGCAACHQHGAGDQQIRWTRTAPAFARMNPAAGCLSAQPPAGVPVFAVTDQQRQDLQQAIAQAADQSAAAADVEQRQAQVDEILLTLNCTACHQRGELGGVPDVHNELFTGRIPEMGDEGRIPPQLDGVGDKLQEAWLRHVLQEGARDRPAMLTRMPRFGIGNVGQLVEHLVALDQRSEVADVEFAVPVHRVRADARLMVGDQALSCIKCHAFDKYAATGIQSVDMTTMTQRLRRDWFHRYLLNPQTYRPGTRMPAAWPNGRSVVPKILDGSAAVQIEAIWQYLQDGKQARLPSGLQRDTIELRPTDRPLIYRNFLEGLSPRGIAVGFREKAHLAWDAEHMTLRRIWHGAFIDASLHWEGRGPGRQVPMGDHVLELPPGPPVAVLESPEQPWPDQNPREAGFQFRGYELTAAGVPAFQYTWRDLQVRDETTAVAAVPDAELERRLTVTLLSPLTGTLAADSLASAAQSGRLYVRIASGTDIQRQADGWQVDGALRLRFAASEPVVRRVGERTELLVPVRLQPGQPLEISYRMVW